MLLRRDDCLSGVKIVVGCCQCIHYLCNLMTFMAGVEKDVKIQWDEVERGMGMFLLRNNSTNTAA